MIPADVLNSLKTLLLAQKPLPQVAPAAAIAPEFELGQKLQATVQAQMAPGVFRVRVGDQLMQLQLPNTIRSGDTITLQVASLLPRLTFSMAASANPLSTADKLSDTSRLLSSLTRQPAENSFLRPTSSAPLWTGAALFPDTTELAGKLHATISQSGLFYESHQAQWLAGSRNTAQLLQEPQNLPAEQLKSAWGLADKAVTAGATAWPQAAESAQGPAPPLQNAQNAQNLKPGSIKAELYVNDKFTPASIADAHNNSASVTNAQELDAKVANTNVAAAHNDSAPVVTVHEKISIPGIPDHLQPLIQQQLNALETRQVQWQGQVWPDQEMNWRIREETSHSPDGEEGSQWATQINLDLPNLGEVTATLRFGNNGLSVTLDAAKEGARSKLGTATSQLVSLLAERGISVSSALVTQHDN